MQPSPNYFGHLLLLGKTTKPMTVIDTRAVFLMADTAASCGVQVWVMRPFVCVLQHPVTTASSLVVSSTDHCSSLRYKD